jgi:biotin operon repressor
MREWGALEHMSTENDLVSGEEIARWLGLSGKEIYDLAKAGILVRVGRAYRLEESVRRYCDHLRRIAAAGSAA